MKESQNIEFKTSWRDEYLKWICGYANADGGILSIGKDDNGNAVGLTHIEKLLEDIPNKVRDILGIMVDVNLKSDEGEVYLDCIGIFIFFMRVTGRCWYKIRSSNMI